MGFLYLASNEKLMRISVLPSGIIYDTPYPFRRAKLNKDYGQVNHIVYMLQNEVYGVVTSMKQPITKVCTIVNEEKNVETFEKDDNFIYPDFDKYTLRVRVRLPILKINICLSSFPQKTGRVFLIPKLS